MPDTNSVYKKLLAHYGSRGWWPIVTGKLECCYHTGSPRDNSEVFEIMLGAILTQGVSWNNVQTAMILLKRKKLLSPRKLNKLPDKELAELIRSTGYFNQKVLKTRELLRWYKHYSYSATTLETFTTENLREELLSVKGIGPETADSILLYALGKKIFVIDAFTKRIFSRIGFLHEKASYMDFQQLFHDTFTGNTNDYKEFHALIVAHSRICKKNKPLCDMCPLQKICDFTRR